MLARSIRRFLFFLIHFVVDILVAIQNVYQRFRVKKCILRKCEVTNSDIQSLLEHVPKMTKRLKHLVILADTDYHSMSDLARLVIWSLVAGIPYVSFHDITGELKAQEEKLFCEVERNKKGVPGCIKWDNKPNLNGYTNGIQSHTIIINVFSQDDGRPKIAEYIKKMARDNVNPKKIESLNAQELDEELASVYPTFPDPDLVLYTGSSLCTHGLLPWHIRLSEFIQLSLDHSVDIVGYVDALYKYNKCDQRFGK